MLFQRPQVATRLMQATAQGRPCDAAEEQTGYRDGMGPSTRSLLDQQNCQDTPFTYREVECLDKFVH